jgi:hypothetical protein
MRFFTAAGLALVGTVAVQTASMAHHSVGGQFDVSKSVVLVGTVARVDWVNPHIYVHLDVKDAQGKVVQWSLGTVPVAMARKAGITKESLFAAGQTLKMTIYPARDGTANLGFLRKIEYPDGHVVEVTPDKL